MSKDGSVTLLNGTIRFEGGYRPADVPIVNAIVNELLLAKPPQVVLDFRKCTVAFPNSMLPLIASVARLRALGYSVHTVPPELPFLNKLFAKVNWAHYLSPAQFKPSDDITEKHLAVYQYQTLQEHVHLTRSIIDVILGTTESPRSSVAALEWAIIEIMDNVLTHANSVAGGFVQLAWFPNAKRFAFCVADCGCGIRESLSEGYPTLQSDQTAIEMAVRAGVTRNSEIGQGNGLSGSLNIAIRTNGLFRVESGNAEIVWVDGRIEKYPREKEQGYYGTIIDVQIPYDINIDLGNVLNEASHTPTFSSLDYAPTDFLETHYLSQDGRNILVSISSETVGFGTRLAGRQMRTKCKNLMTGELSLPLVIDWNGIQVIASSFADEFLGKMFMELGPLAFMSRVHNINMTPVVRALIDRAILQRTRQGLTGAPDAD